MDKHNSIGKCPVCGKGDIIPRGTYGYTCDYAPQDGRNCDFHIHKEYGTCFVDDDMAREIITKGTTKLLQLRNSENGKTYAAYLRIVGGKVKKVYPPEYINGKCPKCGGKIIRTANGWACEQKCGIYLPKHIMQREITEKEAVSFFSGHQDILDGFHTKNQRVFPSFLEFTGSSVSLHIGPVATCPICGGNVYLSNKVFGCSQYAAKGCPFRVYRNIRGHAVTVSEARELCDKGTTGRVEFQNSTTGEYYQACLALNDKKEVVLI